MEWLEQKIWPLERHLEAHHVYAATRLACLEMLSSGTTTFHDMYFQPESAAAAAADMGMRAVISRVFFDVFTPAPLPLLRMQLGEGLRGLTRFPRVVPSLGPHAAYTVSLEALGLAYQLAEEHDTLVHFHLAETEREMLDFRQRHGRGLIEALDAVGFLGSRLVAAHGIWLDEEDIRQLGLREVSIVHCPSSNMKLGSGWSSTGVRALPWSALQRAGVRVALGTDGAAANNSLDMFEAMKLAALLQKHTTGDPAVLTAHQAFAMATEAGADALRLNAGRIEPGYRADLTLIDLDRPYLVPGHDLVADLVYAGRPDCVDSVIVDGQVVLHGRRHRDFTQVIAEARTAAGDLLAKARQPGSAG
jgi:5-methylthioadenosine/S-adenosylhomocysteine deaminase